MRRLLTAVAVLALALTGCGDPPESGYVLQKEYSAPYSWTTLNCASYNKNGLCTAYIPVTYNEPAHWRLLLVDDNKQDFQGWRDVDETTYHRYGIGDHYPDPR